MINFEKKYAIKSSLQQIEQELIALGLWSYGKNRPNDKAFLSTTPFFMDTMEFHQWLEFVLIPKITVLLETQEQLPANVQIHTFAQEVYRGKWHEYKQLITKLKEFDKLFGGD
ncbi:MAG: YqcC family protein [Succinivibrio sp.]|nr:YqcC family protein [Succinivibrio sp.]